jgi:peptide chain release factor subunit 1
MPKFTTALETPLRNQLDRLTAFEPTDSPVLSLYLDMRAGQHGRTNYDAFLRKTFAERSRVLKGAARQSFDADVEKITAFLGDQVRRSAQGLAIFACNARDGFFESVQLEVPVEHHWLFIGSVPHLYPLIRLNDQFPRYAALLVDSNAARLFVFGLGATETQTEVKNVKTRKGAVGGWSQARYQRHVENFHLHHTKEVVDVLDRVMREEALDRLVIACEPTARGRLMEQLPKHLADKVVDLVKIDIRTPENQVLARTLEALREHDADTDAEHVERMLDAWNADGLAVAGPEETLQALEKGQVEELLITATPELLRRAEKLTGDVTPAPVDVDTSAPATTLDSDRHRLADHFVVHAHMSAARIRFIEDAALLEDVGGVGALLRFKL